MMDPQVSGVTSLVLPEYRLYPLSSVICRLKGIMTDVYALLTASLASAAGPAFVL